MRKMLVVLLVVAAMFLSAYVTAFAYEDTEECVVGITCATITEEGVYVLDGEGNGDFFSNKEYYIKVFPSENYGSFILSIRAKYPIVNERED